MDDEPRPNKTPRAFVATPRIPDEVILVVRPGGGPDDYAAYLHELGHALHFANTDPGLPVEYRRLGDPSVTEAWAFLLDGLLRERGWLKRFVGIGQPREALRFTAFHKLWFLRRYAAKLEYELFLHAEGPGRRSREAYRDLLSDATQVDWPADLFLCDVDPFFYAARYLRAWIFEAQLRDLLRERFDEEWYRNDRTGPFLLALWRQGQRHTIEELAADLGLGAPSIDPLLAQIAADLALTPTKENTTTDFADSEPRVPTASGNPRGRQNIGPVCEIGVICGFSSSQWLLPAASSRAKARYSAASARAASISSCPAAHSCRRRWARSRARSARATSISSAVSAVSTKMLTRFPRTSAYPADTASRSSSFPFQ